MNDDVTTVCLIGDTKYGKTSLIATIKGCLEAGAHGYGPGHRFELQVVNQPHLTLEAHLAGSFNEIEEQFFSGQTTTPTEETREYFFDITMHRRSAFAAPSRAPRRVRLVDTGGAVWMGSIDKFILAMNASEAGTRFRANFEHYRDEILPGAKALVLVVPLVELWQTVDEVAWRRRMKDLLNAISDEAKYAAIERIVVAMTHYERLFVNFGALAAEVAVDADVAKAVLREAIGQMRKRGLAEQLFGGSLGENRQIVFVPVSAHGFVKSNGCPNFDPKTNQLLPRRIVDGKPILQRDIWRPFCSADPFLFAAFGEKSRFMYSLDELEGRQSGIPIEPPGSGDEAEDEPRDRPSPAEPPTWRRLFRRRPGSH